MGDGPPARLAADDVCSPDATFCDLRKPMGNGLLLGIGHLREGGVWTSIIGQQVRPVATVSYRALHGLAQATLCTGYFITCPGLAVLDSNSTRRCSGSPDRISRCYRCPSLWLLRLRCCSTDSISPLSKGSRPTDVGSVGRSTSTGVEEAGRRHRRTGRPLLAPDQRVRRGSLLPRICAPARTLPRVAGLSATRFAGLTRPLADATATVSYSAA
jgi:hypothetical protein